MTPLTSFAGKNVALFGLGGSGLVTAQALLAGGARVSAWDDGAAARDKAQAAGLALTDLNSADWSQFSAFVLSPGVPLTHPVPHWTVPKARQAGVEIIGDIELFCRERRALAPGAPFIAITGTNGKSTTTALIAHILREAGRDVQMGGNIGVPILALEPPAEGRIHVIECSSFQIDLAPTLKPGIGVLLNVTPDHIDRHGTMKNYAAIKERLVSNSTIAVIGVDDDYCRDIAGRLIAAQKTVSGFSAAREDAAGVVFHDQGRLFCAVSLLGPGAIIEMLVDLNGIGTLRGAHNGQNAAAAFIACARSGVPHDVIGTAMRSFAGLPHRMEQVGERGPVLFINDSKATNADSTEKALLSFDDIFWIAGGKAKEGGIEPLRPHFARVAKAYLIGAAAPEFAATLAGSVPYEICGTLEAATSAAAHDAAASGRANPVVLLSPACASYDQFANFEARGARFRDLVAALEHLPTGG
ncbi:MAG: UDP-N-acetylmuramoyl-L-alanine--D-glutamate ligase [Hyphomicrobiales bacterium]|nr:UDP-N-acetylmuramoyl-L-alanine--D-glutamate ligase [Hyphomicrobiales bacterium]